MRRTIAILAAALTTFAGAATAAAGDGKNVATDDSAAAHQASGGLFTRITGELDRGSQGYRLSVEHGDKSYRLVGGDGLLPRYAGKRVTVTGTTGGAVQGQESNALRVRIVQPHPRGDALPERGGTNLTFRVGTEGDLPDGMRLYGLFAKPEGAPSSRVAPIGELGAIALHDFDGDGVHTASVGLRQGTRVVARIATGTVAQGPTEVIHPQSIIQRDNTVTLNQSRIVGTEYDAVRSCDDVPFAPQTDHGAFGIRAVGTDCGTARAVAADAEGNLGSNYRSHRFTCLAQEADSELGGYEYTCYSGVRRVTFAAS